MTGGIGFGSQLREHLLDGAGRSSSEFYGDDREKPDLREDEGGVYGPTTSKRRPFEPR